MICTRCGTNIPDGMPCACGMPGGGPYSSNPAVNLIKQLGASKMFFAVALLSTIGIVLSFASSFVATPNEMYDVFYNYPELYPYVESFLDEGGGGASTMIGAIFGSMINVLVTIGLWLFHTSCKNTSSGGVNVSGLSMIRGFMIFILVLLCIVFGLSIIVMAIAIPVVLSEGGGSYEVGIAVLLGICLAVVAVVAAVIIPYYVSIVKTIKNIRDVCQNGIIQKNVSQFLIVMNYIIAVFTFLSSLLLLTTNFLSALGSISGAVLLILVSQLLSAYRKEANRILYGQPAPVQAYTGYGQPNAQQQYQQNMQYQQNAQYPQNTQYPHNQPIAQHPQQQYQQPVQNASWQPPAEPAPAPQPYEAPPAPVQPVAEPQPEAPSAPVQPVAEPQPEVAPEAPVPPENPEI